MTDEKKKLEKSNKMLRKVIQLSETTNGMELQGDFYINSVKKQNDEYVLIQGAVKDIYSLSTKDDRKVDNSGFKYSQLQILYFKKELSDIPVDFLRKGDIVRIFCKHALGFEQVDKEEVLRKELLSSGFTEEQVKIIIQKMIEKGEIKRYEPKPHYFGYRLQSVKLTDETIAEITKFKESQRESKAAEINQSQSSVKDSSVKTDTTGSTSPTSPASPSSPVSPTSPTGSASSASSASPASSAGTESTKHNEASNPQKNVASPSQSDKKEIVNTPTEEVSMGNVSFNWK